MNPFIVTLAAMVLAALAAPAWAADPVFCARSANDWAVLERTTDTAAMRDFARTVPPACRDVRTRIDARLSKLGAPAPTPVTPPREAPKPIDACAQARADWPAASRGSIAVLKAYRDSLPAACGLQRAQAQEQIDAKEAAAKTKPSAPSKPTLSAGTVFRDCPTCPEMVVIPAGSFVMGSPSSEPGRYADEGPQRTVSLRSFAAGRFEVTFDEWDACVADGGCETKPADQGWGRGKRPVINVSWSDAKAYANWLSRKTGERYRLLTEAEWEYAARGGTTSAYWWGASVGSGNANCDGCGSQWDNAKTGPVGSFDANAFGLHDTAGNVREWVEDCYSESYAGAATDGSVNTTGTCASRVYRGGSWSDVPRALRSALRSRYSPTVRYVVLGFRLARTVLPPAP